MSALAPSLQAWFTDRLIRERDASPHTIASYRDTRDCPGRRGTSVTAVRL
jgi:hypothetical protein